VWSGFAITEGTLRAYPIALTLACRCLVKSSAQYSSPDARAHEVTKEVAFGMLTATVALLLSWPVSGSCPDVDGGVPTLRLAIGTQAVLTVPDAAKVRAQHPDVVDLKLLRKDQVLVIGAGFGNTRLTFEGDGGGASRPVEVRRGGCELHVSELSKHFPCSSTLEVRQGDGTDEVLRLEGVASSFEEWRVAHVVVDQFPKIVVLGTLRPDVIEQEFVAADAALRAAGFSRVKWARSGEWVRLEGELHDDEGPKLRALERTWGARLQLVVTQPRAKPKKP
jgi:hypothetical protein